ncbi:MAG: response regulator transcription factor [Opitutaceae bacterium]|nr:response regulator transcription factor [Opitutaceae bacterium]
MSPAPSETPGPAGAKKRLLVVDDHPMTRLGQVETLNREPDLTVCAHVGTVREAMEAIARLRPDLVVTDLTLPDRDGLELLKDIQALHPGLPTLVVSMHEETFYAPRVLRAGGRGYLMKSEGPDNIVAAIRTVLSGRIALSPQMAARLLETFSSQSGSAGGAPESKLTDRELEVLRFSGEGWATEEIAQKMHLSSKTVDVHRGKIKEKLGFKTTPEYLRFAIRWVQAQDRPAPAPAPPESPAPPA